MNDGIVLASDSATTMMGKIPRGQTGVINIYEYADKIFNLKKGLPIGAITYGSGSIGQASISTLAKDFRKLITEERNEWKVDSKNYTIEEVANKFKKFIFDENYEVEFKEWPKKPMLGFMIVGYSSNESLAEEWRIDIKNGKCNGPSIIRKKETTGISWSGEGEVISRIYFGVSPNLKNILQMCGLEKSKIQETVNLCRKHLQVPMVIPAMPIQDAIDLAVYLVETTIKFMRYAPGAATVGGPIEVAAITKHEGFKWVKRKHYYDTTLNPKMG